MTLAAMRLVVAKLLTDLAYQRRFFAASPQQAGEHGLTAEEFQALRQLDPRSLGITTEGYAGKRLERVESAFPRTLRALEVLEPGARWRYLQGTSFPPGDAEERAAFHAHVRAGAGGRGAEAQRFLEDLADLEALLYAAPQPRLPSYRYRPEATRPRAAPGLLRLRTRGPLAAWVEAASPPGPGAYSPQPAECLVHRDGPRVVCEPLGPAGEALLQACDGSRTVADLVARFGAPADEALQRWFRWGAVEDAAP
jgi:hypothetical protein